MRILSIVLMVNGYISWICKSIGHWRRCSTVGCQTEQREGPETRLKQHVFVFFVVCLFFVFFFTSREILNFYCDREIPTFKHINMFFRKRLHFMIRFCYFRKKKGTFQVKRKQKIFSFSLFGGEISCHFKGCILQIFLLC